MDAPDLKDGLDRACEAVGGKAELGRRLGITGPAISQWDKVPAERLLEIENVTGVPRTILRPDIFNGLPLPEDAP